MYSSSLRNPKPTSCSHCFPLFCVEAPFLFHHSPCPLIILSLCFFSFLHNIILPADPYFLPCQHKFCSSFWTPLRSQEVSLDPIGGTLSLSFSHLKFNILIKIMENSLYVYIDLSFKQNHKGWGFRSFLWRSEQGNISHYHQLANRKKVPLHSAQ